MIRNVARMTFSRGFGRGIPRWGFASGPVAPVTAQIQPMAARFPFSTASTVFHQHGDGCGCPSHKVPTVNETGAKDAQDAKDAEPAGEVTPMYQISFTCKRCDTPSSHKMSHQAYHGGTVLVQCPGCKNRHLIADHLKIFSDEPVTIEDIMAKNGEKVTIKQREFRFNQDGGDLEWVKE
ncbi:YALI0F03949p [Yarrowia lipolytica CLIB122]|uniref:YALI0F03949p n=2 Tax=Yarrowia lipolytica TaxID=4952 RepID=Q6C2Z1_YARLI|nr:YALI0F03949p [Yarrowia lipolytica CLIB122]AOW06625.1 hypothetical protein YALI1_F05936g [Yarrowia lipolytica]KAB8284743.1 DNL zinc finger-domain-containing protein [Yarrowia lipolytica]KAE8174839.1 DNL zinc finger-domain-containing protein [Yarrowia lipolytica]KAJ8056146.1 DNL zinc finger-domain-containing protein [Yarrowia lipolytica]RMI97563.1 DNL zinc finger-domain-containing protein [Yarrowia lipolytica]|eukprot:XP_504971.1 YALI0F03949p [Yarrowia lipolytica CLIB122]